MLNNKVDESGEIVTVPHAPLVLAQVDVDLTARAPRYVSRWCHQDQLSVHDLDLGISGTRYRSSSVVLVLSLIQYLG